MPISRRQLQCIIQANIILGFQVTSDDGKISRTAVEDIVRSIKKGDGFFSHKSVTVTGFEHRQYTHTNDEKPTFPILTEPSEIVTNSYNNEKIGIFDNTGDNNISKKYENVLTSA